VLAIELRGLDGTDGELGAVADKFLVLLIEKAVGDDLRARAGVGHGEDTGTSVLELEVLVLELLAIDRLSTGALLSISLLSPGM
jgi:hypothetical protein